MQMRDAMLLKIVNRDENLSNLSICAKKKKKIGQEAEECECRKKWKK